ncbi:MAG: TolC family outer membrane protein [Rhodocyclales bacterium]|nr:TolC family outer membrane protein [Rhodocyclales bacterium]
MGNPEVLSKWHTFKSSIGEVDVARAGLLPKIDYTYGSGRESLRQPGAADKNFTRGGHTVTLNQMLYDGFATSSDVKRLDKARLTRYFELVDAAENAALEAGRAYYDVMRYRLLLLLAESNYVEHRASYEQLLRRAQSGAGRRVDVEHAASRLALAELNLNTEAANLHDVTARFIRLVGEAPPPVLFPPSGLTTDFPATEPDALKLAFRQNPALRAAIENLESAQHDVELRRAGLFPRLDLRIRNEATDNYQGTAGTRQNNIAEVVFSYNIFNGGADMARQTVYAERKNLAMDLRDKACRDIRQTLSIAYNDVERLKAQLSNLDLQVGSIEKTRDAYKAQFNIGQRSLLDLLDTENELLNARRTAVNSDMDLGIAYLRTQAGVGRLMEFLGVRPRGLDDEIHRELDSAGEICPPQVPGSYLVDLEALTARAMAMLEANKPPVADANVSPRPLPPPNLPNPPAAAPLSHPPPMPAPRAPAAPSPGALREPPPRPASALPGASAALSAPVPLANGSSIPESDELPLRLVAATRLRPLARGSDTSVGEDASTRSPVSAQLAAWAAAWSSGRFDSYLGFYAPSFVAADGSSRAEWAKHREARIAGRSGIRVELSDVRVRFSAPSILESEFEQKYRSEGYRDSTRKVLRWIKVGGEWLIDRETTRPPRRDVTALKARQ